MKFLDVGINGEDKIEDSRLRTLDLASELELETEKNNWDPESASVLLNSTNDVYDHALHSVDRREGTLVYRASSRHL